MQLGRPARRAGARVDIAAQMRRLDEVVQGFLKFTRPEDLQAAAGRRARRSIEEMLPIVCAEAERAGVDVRVECPPDLPDVNADPDLLQQAFLNLALNACQAMPNGGTAAHLRVGAGARPARRGRLRGHRRRHSARAPRSGSSICTSRRRSTAAASDCRWCTGPCSCTTARSRSSRSPGRGTTFRVLLRQA